ncbi:hypothetical protein G9A89_018231 [Geosiphon pyriformis]|nr:hypothetical protein G9A89_018231 [Geosiphon pyriformis]
MVLFDDATSDEHELLQDILPINTVFICRIQRRRAACHRREPLSRGSGRKDPNEHKDKKLQKAAIWGECKFIRTVVYLGSFLRIMHGKVPANIYQLGNQ